jgi:hypothetical protein
MMKARRAIEVHALLLAIDQEFKRYMAGEAEAHETISELNVRVGVLRDALWHEVPRFIAQRMDEEEPLTEVGQPTDFSTTPEPQS